MTSPRGAFIVIEGLDRSGKSTQTALLQSALQQAGRKVELLKFPDRTTTIGKMIDAYLRSENELDDKAVHLLFSANRWEAVTKILKLLESGTSIVCDRYAFSGVAFSTAKYASHSIGNGEPLSYEWCQQPDKGLPEPDLILFLDISAEDARKRGGYGEERYEKEEMQGQVRTIFAKIAAGIEDKWVTIDAGRTQEAVQNDVWKVVQPLFEKVLGRINKLWL